MKSRKEGALLGHQILFGMFESWGRVQASIGSQVCKKSHFFSRFHSWAVDSNSSLAEKGGRRGSTRAGGRGHGRGRKLVPPLRSCYTAADPPSFSLQNPPSSSSSSSSTLRLAPSRRQPSSLPASNKTIDIVTAATVGWGPIHSKWFWPNYGLMNVLRFGLKFHLGSEMNIYFMSKGW